MRVLGWRWEMAGGWNLGMRTVGTTLVYVDVLQTGRRFFDSLCSDSSSISGSTIVIVVSNSLETRIFFGLPEAPSHSLLQNNF